VPFFLATELEAFRKPIISFPSGSIRLKVTAAKPNKTTLEILICLEIPKDTKN
jgi:hypothetical protein